MKPNPDDALRAMRSAMDRPSPARMYDYFLGGAHNFAVDREAAEEMLSGYPDVARVAQTNRAFLHRATRFLVDQGIDQFLDLGSGIPTAGNVHEIVHERNPDAHVVYVDIDPIAVHHSLEILKDTPTATAVRADICDPQHLFDDPEVRRMVDFSRPAAVLVVASLHFVPDDRQMYAAVGFIRRSLAPGSYLVLSHSTYEGTLMEGLSNTEQLYARISNPLVSRTREQLLPLLDGLEVVEPGITYAPLWRPDRPDGIFADDPPRSVNLVGVGRIPMDGIGT